MDLVAPPWTGWIAVGRVEDLPLPGAWLKAPLTPAGVVVVRQPDGALLAFHAICTHRGTAFLQAEEGLDARFTCPYHNFQFELDGRACASVANLAPVRLGVAHGFVFVTLDDAAPPLAEALGTMPPWLERANLGQLRRARRVAYDVAAGWSLVVENFQESLHFASVHPALEALTPSAEAETWMPEGGGPWLGGIMPIVAGAETVSTSGSRQGRPWLVPEEDRRVVHDAMRLPNLLTSVQPDSLLTFVVFARGEGRSRVIASTYVHEDAAAESLEDVLGFWTQVCEEDRVACERQQLGLASREMKVEYTDVEEGAAAVASMVRGSQTSTSAKKHCGVFGRPYADLQGLLDTSEFPAIHREITRGLATVETSYTGGTLKWMGVTAPWVEADGYRDAMHVIRAMSQAEVAELATLADDGAAPVDPTDPALAFGDETDHPFSRAQMRLLEQRHGVYFPWKVCYHLLENDRWEDKHSGEGKGFGEEAREVFPQTVAFIEALPFVEIGRVVVFGLLANDHAPAHRDSEPGKALALAQSISFEPSRLTASGEPRHKRFYLRAPDGSNEVIVDSPIYWFNDMDWHGVHADPYFRYSVRVDGVFDPGFLERIRRETARRR